MAKYPWGDVPFEPKYMPAIIGLSALIVAMNVNLTTPSGPSVVLSSGTVNVEPSMMTVPKGVVLVTLAWIHVYNQCIGHQLALKMGHQNDNPVRK